MPSLKVLFHQQNAKSKELFAKLNHNLQIQTWTGKIIIRYRWIPTEYKAGAHGLIMFPRPVTLRAEALRSSQISRAYPKLGKGRLIWEDRSKGLCSQGRDRNAQAGMIVSGSNSGYKLPRIWAPLFIIARSMSQLYLFIIPFAFLFCFNCSSADYP